MGEGRVWDATTCGVVDGNGNGVKSVSKGSWGCGSGKVERVGGQVLAGGARKKTGLTKLPAATPNRDPKWKWKYHLYVRIGTGNMGNIRCWICWEAVKIPETRREKRRRKTEI